MNRTKTALSFAVLLCLLMCGCGRDASQLTVVTGIGVDGLPGAYRISTEVIRLSENDENNQSVSLGADGRTITDGINSLVSKTGRSLYCNHTQVLVIGRETAEAGLDTLLDELLRGTQYPISMRIAIAKETAAGILGASPVVSDLHSVEMEDMIREGAVQCLVPDLDVCSFYQEVYAQGIEGVLPFMDLREDHGEQICTLAGAALFRGTKLLTVLDQEDSRCLMWMRGKSGGTLVTDHGLLEVTHLERTLRTDKNGATLTLKLTLTASSNEENKDAVMQEAERAMVRQCESLLTRLKQLQCDAVGFGNHLYQTSKGDWAEMGERWPERFASYPIRIQVQVEQVIWGRIWSTKGRQ